MKIGDIVKLKYELAYRRYGIIHSVSSSPATSMTLVKVYHLGPKLVSSPSLEEYRLSGLELKHKQGGLVSNGYLADELILVSSA